MLLTIIVFLITISTLVLVHEFGHFLVAKKAGIKVEEFGFGYPPRILAKKIGETTYSINWILFGGFVRLYGEELKELRDPEPRGVQGRAFWAKSKKVRTAVILAGVLANFLLGVFLFSTIYSISGIPTETNQINIVGLALGSPADKAGLKEGDLIVAVDGESLDNIDRFVELISQKTDREVQIVVAREKDNPCLQPALGVGVAYTCQDGQLAFFLTPREKPPEGEGPLGVSVSSRIMKKYPLWQMPIRGAIEGLKETFAWTGLIISSLGKMLADLFISGKVPDDVAGPVGIFQVTGAVAQTGVLSILRFIGILSVNLAIINVFPFPALDGGRMVFVVYEAITRRRPRPAFERWVNVAGMAFLLALLVLVTINDIDRLVDLNAFWVRLKDNLWF